MAHRKAGGSAKNLRDSNPKYLGTKVVDGQLAQTGSIIVRQRGTKIVAGNNVGVGKDHTLFALADGVVKFGIKRKTHFDGKRVAKKAVSVVSPSAVKKTAKKAPVKKEKVEKVAKKAAPKVESKKPTKKATTKTTNEKAPTKKPAKKVVKKTKKEA